MLKYVFKACKICTMCHKSRLMFYTLQISINSISQHVCRFSVCIRFTGILYPFLWITVTDITLNPLLFMKIQWQVCIFYCYALIYRNIKTNSFNVKRITKHVFKVISPMSKLVLWCTGTSLISWFLVVIFICSNTQYQVHKNTSHLIHLFEAKKVFSVFGSAYISYMQP